MPKKEIDIGGIRLALAEDVDVGVLTQEEAGIIEVSYLNNDPVTLEELREVSTESSEVPRSE